MRVISRRPIREFIEHHPDAESSLDAWWRVAAGRQWRNLAEVRQDWGAADLVGRLTVFNISKNKYRLIARIDYVRQRIYVRHVLTHTEYDKEAWKNDPWFQQG